MLCIMIGMNIINIITYSNSFMIKNNIKFKLYDTYDTYNTHNNYTNNKNSCNITADIQHNNNFNLTNDRHIYLLNNIF